MNDYDVAIVGGRVAGASTALLLARAGLRVAVLERSGVGSDTVSTHALMRGGVLRSLGGECFPTWSPPGHRQSAVSTSTTRMRHSPRLSTPQPGCRRPLRPRRRLLDRVLIEAAASSGADVLHGVPVVGLLRDPDGRVLGVRMTGADGHDVPVRAGLTIGADGVGSLVAREVGAPFVNRGRKASAILYRYVSDIPSEGYVWGYGDGAAAGLIPTNAGETSCSWPPLPSVCVPSARGHRRRLRRPARRGS